MRPTTSPGTKAYLRAALLLLVLSFVVPFDAGSCFAQDTRVFLFDVSPEKSYTIVKNTTLLTTVNSSSDGVAHFSDAPVAGDVYEISENDTPAEPPSAPTGLAAQGDDLGCSQLSWNAVPEVDVDFYRVYYGETSVAGGGATAYDDSVDVAGATATTICGLVDGTWYFAVRAHNTAGLLSELSQETSASVSNGSTQPPLPPLLLSADEGDPGCVELVWLPDGSPDVTGYVVDYGRESVAGGADAYEFSVDVGNVSSYSICELSSGTWYVAVRAKNFAGMLSAYSAELPADVIPTAVFITAFTAEVGEGGVELEWRIWADEAVEGYSLRRVREGDTDETVLNGGRLLGPATASWTDGTAEAVTTYLYSLVVVGEDNTEYRSPAVRVTTPAWSVTLEQNVPNPFNPSTAISFVVPATTRIRLDVYDVTGALVKTLVDGMAAAGRRTVMWDGTNSAGDAVGSGAYFYRLVADNRTTTRKMLLLK